MRNSLLALSLAFLIRAPDAVCATTSSTPAAPYLGSCSYYDHLSAALSCPADGYLLSFGARYCKKFERDMSRFTRAGWETVSAIRFCLQQKLEATRELSCANVGAVGTASHVDCYVEGGFCEMDFWDSAALTSVVWPALLTSEMSGVPAQVERECLTRRHSDRASRID